MFIQGKGAAGRVEEPARFFDLVERLFADMGALLDQKLILLTMELKNEGEVVVRNLLILLVGAVFATLGLLLLGMAAALWIGAVTVRAGRQWLGDELSQRPTSQGLMVAMSTDPPVHWTRANTTFVTLLAWLPDTSRESWQ